MIHVWLEDGRCHTQFMWNWLIEDLWVSVEISRAQNSVSLNLKSACIAWTDSAGCMHSWFVKKSMACVRLGCGLFCHNCKNVNLWEMHQRRSNSNKGSKEHCEAHGKPGDADMWSITMWNSQQQIQEIWSDAQRFQGQEHCRSLLFLELSIKNGGSLCDADSEDCLCFAAMQHLSTDPWQLHLFNCLCTTVICNGKPTSWQHSAFLLNKAKPHFQTHGCCCWLLVRSIQLLKQISSLEIMAVLTLATCCGGSWSGNFKDTIAADVQIFQHTPVETGMESCLHTVLHAFIGWISCAPVD